MAEYLVTWEINIEAATPEDAARIARQAQTDPGSYATVFDVCRCDDGEIRRVDLTELDQNEAAAALKAREGGGKRRGWWPFGGANPTGNR